MGQPGFVYAAAAAIAGATVAPSPAPQAPTFYQQLQTNIGQDATALLRRLGPPQQEFTMPNGDHFYRYNFSLVSFACVVDIEISQRNVVVYAQNYGC